MANSINGVGPHAQQPLPLHSQELQEEAPPIQPIPVQVTPPKTVVVMGSSYVNHLDGYLDRNNIHNLMLDTRDYDILFYGVSGMGLLLRQSHKTLAHHIKYVNMVTPDVLCILCGSNDVVRSDPSTIAGSLMGMAGYAKAAGVKAVYIMQLLPRRGKHFNNRLFFVNKAILEKIDQENDPTVRFWRHKGLMYPAQETIDVDSVHLNEHGNGKLFRSVRGCIMRAVKML